MTVNRLIYGIQNSDLNQQQNIMNTKHKDLKSQTKEKTRRGRDLSLDEN